MLSYLGLFNLIREFTDGCTRIVYNCCLDLKRIMEIPKLKEMKIRGYCNLKQLPGRINAAIKENTVEKINCAVKQINVNFYVLY